MKPQIKLATAQTPDGGQMELYQHDRDFLIRINGQDGSRKLGVYSGSAVALSGGTFSIEPLHHENLAAEFPPNLSG